MKVNTRTTAAGVFAAFALAAAGTCAAQRCVAVSGKIENNFSSATSTLGVVAMVYGSSREAIRLKCGLAGTQTEGTGDINFIHAISCDDTTRVPLPGDIGSVPVHSSIFLYTTGRVLPPQDSTQLFSFAETSVPITSAPARGLFAGVTGGQIRVDGAVYKAPDGVSAGSIDMTFKGQVCY